MQQLSHHTLNSALVFWTFITFIVPPGFVWLTRLLLKARDDSACIVCLMSAIFQRAGQHKFSRRQSLAFSCSFAVVEGKQDGHVALLAANTEIPPHVGLGPSRNIQRISLPSERMRRSEEHTSELQSPDQLVCRLLLEKKKNLNRRARRQGPTERHATNFKRDKERDPSSHLLPVHNSTCKRGRDDQNKQY